MTATMIKIENNDKMTAAIERCKQARPKVRRIDANTVSVVSARGSYTVKFSAPKPGLLLAECDCKAGKDGMLCYHVPGAMAAPVAAPARRGNPEGCSSNARVTR